MLEVDGLGVTYGNLRVIRDVDFTVEDGEWLMIVGPNGAGKSTIVNAIAQITPYTGRILSDGVDLEALKPSECAKRVGVLLQQHAVSYSFTAEEVVRLGRYSYSPSALGTMSEEDEEHIARAIAITGIEDLADHSVLTLSGGELQRVFLAQLFAQDPRMLILDEPTNHLDLIYQKQVLELVRLWVRATKRGVISVVHDLSLAKMYATKVLLLKQGQTFAYGPTDEIMVRENLDEVFGMDVFAWMSALYTQWT